MGENMPLQQWELYESMSVLNDSCTTKTTTTICNAPGTSQGYRRSGDGASTNTTTAAAAAGNDWSLAAGESPQQCAVKKRPAADDSLNTFPAAAATAAEAIAAVGNIERRMTKKINIVKENTDETDQNRNSDENLQFLLSLLPYLRDVPKHRKLSVRHKLQKVFIDEQEKSLAAFTGYHQPAVPVTRATATVPNAVRGPPPPSYPGKNDFGFVTPAQNLNAFNNNNNNNKNTTKTVPIHCSALVQCNNVDDNPSLPKPYNNCCAIKNCSFNNDSVCSNDVPLLNVDYTASVKPTIYYNTNIFSTQQQQQQQPGTVFVTSGNVVNSADYSVVAAAAAAAAAAQRTDLHYNNNFVTPAASTHTRPGSTSLNIIGTATVADIATSTLDFSADSYNNNNNNVNNNVIATVIAAAEETDNDSWTYRAM